jgi:hypothetical protein
MKDVGTGFPVMPPCTKADLPAILDRIGEPGDEVFHFGPEHFAQHASAEYV